MTDLNPVWREPFYTVKEFYNWKINAEAGNSVEISNKEKTDLLQWERTDTLYSFQKIYQIGLQLPDYSDQLVKARETVKGRISDRNTQSLLCVKMQSLNEEIEKTEFLSVYFYLGNVIPIWPGGNQDKGAGYDLPEPYFNKNIYWTDCLLNKYHNACMSDIINSQVDTTKIRTDSKAYFDYLSSRRDIIIKRTKELSAIINQILYSR